MGVHRKDPKVEEVLPRGLYLIKGRYFIKFMHDGAWVRAAGGTRFPAACKTLDDLREKAKRGELKNGKRGMTLQKFWDDHYRAYAEKAKRSFARDLRTWTAFLQPEFGKLLLPEVNSAAVSPYMQKRREDVAAATANRELALLKAMLTRAKRTGLIDGNPLSGHPAFPEDNERTPVLTLDNEKVLLTACRDVKRKAPRYLHDLVLMALRTGARMSELLSLRWADVVLSTSASQGPQILIRDSKNKQPREVPLSDDVVFVLKGREKVQKDLGTDLVFSVEDDEGAQKPVTQMAATQAFRRISQRLKLPGGAKDPDAEKGQFLRFHDLRHVAGGRWHDQGADTIALMDMLGHKSIAMARRYSATSIDHRRKLIDAAASAANGTSKKKKEDDKHEAG